MPIVSGRFTPYDDKEFTEFVDFMTRLCCQSCLIVKHDAHSDEDEDEKGANRTHCHFVLEFTKSASRWLQLFHEYFNKVHNTETNYYKGNSNVSKKEIKKEDHEKALWYICKYDQPQVLLKVGYTENDIERFHTESVNYVSALKKQKQNENVKPPKEYKEKVKTLTFPQIVAKALKEKNPNGFWDFTFREHRRTVFETTCDMLGQYGKTLDDLIIHRLMNGVMMILDPDSCKMLFRKKCIFDKYDQDACKD